MPNPAPDYDVLARLLAVSPLAPSPAEVHGIYAGLAVSEPAGATARWLAELLPGAAAPAGAAGPSAGELEAALRALASHTDAALADVSLGFTLLLPDEEQGLPERADALLDWTRGLLYGLGLAGLDTNALSPPAREAVADLLEVTRLDLDDLNDPDADQANELALIEVIEFIRVAVMLLQAEPRSRP